MIMSRGQKLRIGIIILMMLIGGVLETLSVSLVLPLVTAIMQPDFIETNQYAKMVCELFDLHSANTFMIIVIFALIAMYIGKNLFLYLEFQRQLSRPDLHTSSLQVLNFCNLTLFFPIFRQMK